jgi:ABC-type transport system substrate-binding protein
MPAVRRWLAALAALWLACGAGIAADLDKTLRVCFPIAETGFDPAGATDLYSNQVNRAIFDPLYSYAYLTRPYTLVPNTAAGMPEISADGRTWTIRVRPGIYFADDPAFKGGRRELTAADYVYSWKRLLDPKILSTSSDVFDETVVGAAEAIAAAKKAGRFDYDATIEGLQAVDRYTIRIRLTRPDYDLQIALAGVATAAVAREVIEAYADPGGRAMANPVGTGPYLLKQWRRGQKITLEANPNFREERFPESADPADQAVVAQMRGKRLPAIGRIEISILEEANPRLLAFESRDLDYVDVPPELIWNVLDGDKRLRHRFVERGVSLWRGLRPAIRFTYFNMDDPVVGGYAKEKIALRRAIGMAYNTDEEARVVWQGQAEPATQFLPPHVFGYDPAQRDLARYDVATAKALLDRFGYLDRDGDGWRDLPDGKPFTLVVSSPPTTQERQTDELWKKNMAAVGLRVDFNKQKWPDLLKAGRLGKLQMFTLGNIANSTNGYGYFGLLWGKQAGFSNIARFRLPEYDRLYEQGLPLPNGPERLKLMRRMSDLVNAYAPWKFGVYRYENVVVHPWVQGYKHSVFNAHFWKYYDVDLARRAAAK